MYQNNTSEIIVVQSKTEWYNFSSRFVSLKISSRNINLQKNDFDSGPTLFFGFSTKRIFDRDEKSVPTDFPKSNLFR